MTTNRRWMLARLPQGQLTVDDFELRPVDIDLDDAMPADHVTCRVLWLSIDAAGRAWMQGATYRAAMEADDVMAGYGIAEVVRSGSPSYTAGQLVTGEVGWQDYAVLPVRGLLPVERRPHLACYLNVLGITGLTAYFGLLDVGRPQPGETVVVSAAAGATGNLVGQIATRHGCRAVGICGSDDKARWLTDDLGFAAAVNYRDPDFRKQLKAACPDGVDVYFDNVGGSTLDAVLARMNLHGRVACCGVVSQYDTGSPAPGPQGIPGLLVTKRLAMGGFIVTDYAGRFEEALAALESWLDDGSLIATEDILEGLDRAPGALVGLLAGDNIGKRLVHVGDPGADDE
ncbi:MAG: NADP-dependent oxidoreductase [Actinomycetota bacterium]|nr:NADP-dependent oxidoreductase [Actinomycetota bacterium]